jgi:hypothetical protein
MSIQTYQDISNGTISRTSYKTLDYIFLSSIEHGANCPPFVSKAILDKAKSIYNLNQSNSEDNNIKPGQLKLVGILSSEAAGKALKDCKKGSCLVTFNTGQEDQEILFRDGVTALRRAKVLRISTEAHEQGIDLTQEDLAFNVFGCGLSTIRRDIAYFKNKGIYIPTRGQQKDIGPGVSHKVLAVKLYIERKTELEIARILYHSIKAIERYTRTFAKVVTLYSRNCLLAEIAFLVQISEKLTKEYIGLYNKFNIPEYKDRLDEIINKACDLPCANKKKNLVQEEGRIN